MISAISLTQPWATLMAVSAKKIETRSWGTSYRGWVAIHASKGFPKWAKECCQQDPYLPALIRAGIPTYGFEQLRLDRLPLGAIIAVGQLTDCKRTVHFTRAGTAEAAWTRKIELSEEEWAFGDYSPGRFAWVFENIKALPEPIPCKGALGLWTPPADILAMLTSQLRAWGES